MLEIENRYYQFGKAIRRKYCDFDQYYDIATLLFPEEWQEENADRDIHNTYITNLYELRYLKEENHLYQKNITFITNLLQKAVSKEILPSVETKIEKLVKEQLPQMEKTVVHQLTEQLYLTIKKEAGTEELTRVLQQFFAGDEKVQKISKNVQEQLIHSMLKIAGNTYTQQIEKQTGNTYTQQIQKQAGNTYIQQIQKLQQQENSRYEHQLYLEREKEKIELRQAVPLAEQFLISNYENYLPDTSYVNKNKYFQSVRYLQNTNYQKLLNQTIYAPMEGRYSFRQNVYQQNVDARWDISYPTISIEHLKEYFIEHSTEQPAEHFIEHSTEQLAEHSTEQPAEHPTEHPTVLTLQKMFLEENRNSYQKLYQQERNTYHQNVAYPPAVNTYHQNVDASWDVSYPAISIEHPAGHPIEQPAEHPTEHPTVLMLQEMFLEKNRNSYRKLYQQNRYEKQAINAYGQAGNVYQQMINTYQQDVAYHQSMDVSWDVSYPTISIEHPIEYSTEQSVEHITEHLVEHFTEHPTVLMLQKLFLEESRNSYQKLYQQKRNTYHQNVAYPPAVNTYHQNIVYPPAVNTYHQVENTYGQAGNVYHQMINTHQQDVAYHQNVNVDWDVSYPTISIEHPIEYSTEQFVEYITEQSVEHITEHPTVLTLQKLFLEENRNSYQKLYQQKSHSHQVINNYHQDITGHPTINTYHQDAAYHQGVAYHQNIAYHQDVARQQDMTYHQNADMGRDVSYHTISTAHPTAPTLQEMFLEENRNSYQKLYQQNSYEQLHQQSQNTYLQVRNTTYHQLANTYLQQQDVALVYEQPKEGAQKEQNHTKELIQIKEEVRQNMDFIRETRNVVEQFHEEYEKWKTIQAAPAETTVAATDQGRALIQQEITRSLQKQVDASLNQITGQVYRRLEEKLKSERDRRGLM